MVVLAWAFLVALVLHKVARRPDPDRHSRYIGRSRLAFLFGKEAYTAEAFVLMLPLAFVALIAKQEPLANYFVLAAIGMLVQLGLLRQRERAEDRATRDSMVAQRHAVQRLRDQGVLSDE